MLPLVDPYAGVQSQENEMPDPTVRRDARGMPVTRNFSGFSTDTGSSLGVVQVDAGNGHITAPTTPESPFSTSAVQRSHNLRVFRMNPTLLFMVGPLLRYDSVDGTGVWNGACLIVSECYQSFS